MDEARVARLEALTHRWRARPLAVTAVGASAGAALAVMVVAVDQHVGEPVTDPLGFGLFVVVLMAGVGAWLAHRAVNRLDELLPVVRDASAVARDARSAGAAPTVDDAAALAALDRQEEVLPTGRAMVVTVVGVVAFVGLSAADEGGLAWWMVVAGAVPIAALVAFAVQRRQLRRRRREIEARSVAQ